MNNHSLLVEKYRPIQLENYVGNEHIKKTSKLQMHVVPESESVRSRVEKGTSYDNAWDFKITTMTDEQDDEIPEDVLYAPDFGDTALSQAFTEGGLKKALSDVALQYNRGM